MSDLSNLKPWVKRWPTVALLATLLAFPVYRLIGSGIGFVAGWIDASDQWFEDVRIVWAQWKSRYGW